MHPLLPSLILVHVKVNPNCRVIHNVNATGAKVCIDSCDLKANVQINSKMNKVDRGVDNNLLQLDLYHKIHLNAASKLITEAYICL